ncbi:MAG: XRE family transcriptional regulator [Sedimenticola sp.]
MIGDRIERARNAAGLSQRALAEKIELSAMAISKYERDEVTPGSDVLLRLAQSLGVRVEYFFRSQSVELEGIEFRKRASLSKGDQRRIVADVQDRLERWVSLDEIFPPDESMRFELPQQLPDKIGSMEAVEGAALILRDVWELGHNPIPDLVDTLEEHGIRVIVTPYISKERFDGLAARVGEMPVIAIGSEWPGDRQRFTLAHELGHLILQGRLSGDLNEEKACDRFAGSFLVPNAVVIEALGAKRRWLEPRELLLLKQEYGLSMAGWVFRARDLGVLDKSTSGKFYGFMRKRGWHKDEPGSPYPSESSRLFEKRIYHSLAEDWVGESKAAELLGIPLAELRACRNMECSSDLTD